MARTKKSKQDYSSKLRLRDIELLKVNAQKNHAPDDHETVRLSKNIDYEIVKNDENEVNINLKSSLVFEPKAPFNINLEFLIKYNVVETVTEDEINNWMEDLLIPCASTAALVVAFITEKMLGMPLIIPPIVDLDKERVIKNN